MARKKLVIVNKFATKLSPFNQKQVNYLKKTRTCWLNVAEGGKRAGKNVIHVLAFGSIIENHEDDIFLIGGVSTTSVIANAIISNGYGLLAYFKGRVTKGMYGDTGSQRIAYFVNLGPKRNEDGSFVLDEEGEIVENIKTIIPTGMANKDSHEWFQGLTVGAVWLTEALLLHEESIREAFARTTSSSDKKILLDFNPAPPGHNFYRKFIYPHDIAQLKDKDYGYNFEHFTIVDNSSLTDEHIRKEFSRYDKESVFFKADMLGERVSGAGRIYTSFQKNKVKIAESNTRPVHFTIGIDTGNTDATVVTLIGFSQGYKDVYLLDGYYHKQGKGEDYDDSRYVNEIVALIETWIVKYGGLFNTPIYVDTASKSFRVMLRKRLAELGLNLPVNEAFKKDKIINRIRLNETLLAQGRFFIVDKPIFAPWIEAYENAIWNQKEWAKGFKVRVDDGSYPVDCLDSTEYGMYPLLEKVA